MRSFIVFVLAAVLTAQSGAGAEKRLWAKSFLNQKAPDLVVEKWLTQVPATRGKFVLIDYWATWCGPCRKGIPELNKIHQMFGDKLVVIGISDETEARIRAMRDPRIEYYVGMDTQARMKKILGVTGIPHAILIDPKGIVRWEGYPLLKDCELTPAVVKDVLTRYSR